MEDVLVANNSNMISMGWHVKYIAWIVCGEICMYGLEGSLRGPIYLLKYNNILSWVQLDFRKVNPKIKLNNVLEENNMCWS